MSLWGRERQPHFQLIKWLFHLPPFSAVPFTASHKAAGKKKELRGVRVAFLLAVSLFFFTYPKMLFLLHPHAGLKPSSASASSSSGFTTFAPDLSHSRNYTGSILCYLSVHVFRGVKWSRPPARPPKPACLMSLSFFSHEPGGLFLRKYTKIQPRHMINDICAHGQTYTCFFYVQ